MNKNLISLGCAYAIAEPKAQNPYEGIPYTLFNRDERVRNITTQQVRTLDKKQEFIIAYEKAFGNVRKACAIAGIKSTKTYYNWCKNDPQFKEALKSRIQDIQDYFEDILWAKVVYQHDGATVRWWLRRHHPDYKTKRYSMPPRKNTYTQGLMTISKIIKDDDDDEEEDGE